MRDWGTTAIPMPPPRPAQELRSILRRASRELTVEHGRHWGDDHLHLVQRYLDERHLAAGALLGETEADARRLGVGFHWAFSKRDAPGTTCRKSIYRSLDVGADAPSPPAST